MCPANSSFILQRARVLRRSIPQTLHVERHFTGTATVRDIVIGMSDGLTVPFALAAGLSGAVDNTSIIVTAGVAEIAAGSIAMGLGGYLAARSDAEHYQAERAREEIEVKEKAGVEAEEVSDIFRSYGLTAAESQVLVDALRKRPDSVSTPRSSNRTGGFPASGFRTRCLTRSLTNLAAASVVEAGTSPTSGAGKRPGIVSFPDPAPGIWHTTTDAPDGGRDYPRRGRLC
jgi:VIT family